MASPAEELLEKIAQFLLFHYYVLCPHCAVPNVLCDEDRDRAGGVHACWSCRREFRFGPGDVREYHPAP